MRLGRRQLEAAAGAARVHRAEIERQVGEPEHLARLLGERAAQDRAQAGEQLLELERLRQVVVGAGVEPLDPVADGVARGQHQDRDAVAAAAQPPGDVEAVEAGHHHVENERVGGARVDGRERGVAVGGELHLVAGDLERALQRFAHGAVVVYNEHEHHC